jgi:hypothetical protein
MYISFWYDINCDVKGITTHDHWIVIKYLVEKAFKYQTWNK